MTCRPLAIAPVKMTNALGVEPGISDSVGGGFGIFLAEASLIRLRPNERG
jgi:hypothetical protein